MQRIAAPLHRHKYSVNIGDLMIRLKRKEQKKKYGKYFNVFVMK